MKTWIIAAIVVGLLVFGALMLVVNTKSVQADGFDAQRSCAYGSGGCPYQGQGGCTQEANCGLGTCAAKYGGGCGCGR